MGCNGGKNLGSTKNQKKSLMVNPYSTKSFGYWMLVLGRIRPTHGKLVLSRSTTDFRLVLGPAFGSRTILCCMGNHGRPLVPEMNLQWSTMVWPCSPMLQKKFEKFFLGEIFLKIWLRFEIFPWKTTQNKPGFFRLG